jgi:hypothetical protein
MKKNVYPAERGRNDLPRLHFFTFVWSYCSHCIRFFMGPYTRLLSFLVMYVRKSIRFDCINAINRKAASIKLDPQPAADYSMMTAHHSLRFVSGFRPRHGAVCLGFSSILCSAWSIWT